MSQQQQNLTLLIPDPNGGPSQMIKVMGGKGNQFPFQLTGVSNSNGSSGSQAIKATLKTSTSESSNRGNTVLQANKLPGNIIAIPAKQSVNVQSIRGSQMVVPLNSPIRSLSGPTVDLHNQVQGYVTTTRPSTTMSNSPVVIRTQTGSLSANPPSLQNTYHSKSGNTIIGQHQQPQTINVQQVQSFHPNTMIQPQQVHQQQQNTQQRYQTQQQQAQSISQLSSGTPPKSLITTPILDHSGARKRHDFDFDYSVDSKRRRSERGGKGLRHFSMKVCEKVKAKGTTSYNEVADELVSEFTDSTRCSSPADGTNYDQKNIRRRVYDALNVLMAMNIISKEKKEIRWLGLPTNSAQECRKLETERRKRTERIKLKTEQLQDLILQQIAFKNLVERNRQEESKNGSPSINSAIQLPFIIVNTSKKTVIDCSISNDKTEYLFNFDDTFEIHDDIEVLKRMGMALGLEKGECSPQDLEKVKKMIPKALESYVSDMSENMQECKLAVPEESMDSLDDNDIRGVLSHGSGKLEGSHMMASGFGNSSLIGSGSSISRHSSFASLPRDHRPESASPSSFGEDEDEEMEDYDEEIG